MDVPILVFGNSGRAQKFACVPIQHDFHLYPVVDSLIDVGPLNAQYHRRPIALVFEPQT
jgi:hypothetical protein